MLILGASDSEGALLGETETLGSSSVGVLGSVGSIEIDGSPVGALDVDGCMLTLGVLLGIELVDG